MAAQECESDPLQPVLRLIHCMQKERGASCALVGSLALPKTSDGSFEEHQYDNNLLSARTASNSAISSFYRSSLWINIRGRNGYDNVDIATVLFSVRQLVDGGVGDENEYLFFHDVIVEFNSLLSTIVKVFVVNEVSKRKKDLQMKINAPKLGNKSRRNAKVALSLLDLIVSFVTLKESLGIERALLGGLMANGIDENDEHRKEVKKSNNGTRLNLVVNDLVVVVENQHRIMRDLKKQSDRASHSPSFGSPSKTKEVDELLFDDNYCTLLKLVNESIRPSDAMHSLQDHIRQDFDVNGFQQAMTKEEFWASITIYMDRLHGTMLFLLEELENCEGSFEDLDLLYLGRSLGKGQPSQSNLNDAKNLTPNKNPLSSSIMKTKEHDGPALEEWEISLYDVQFHKRIGRGSAGTTYLGKYCQQDVAIKVAATSEMGLEGWTAELMTLKTLHHTNIIRFLGAIYNPSPLTYCVVLEYCGGGDLEVALTGNTPPKFFTNVASGVANGMYYLHKMKYMHRDIKPSNVLLSGDPKSGSFVAKLTDFGLAVTVQNASVNNLTAETGTYRYMAPEVIRHECYNYAADVYSFGLLMWEIITREKPFEPKSQIEAAGAVAISHERPPFPEGIPLVVKGLIEKCWADKPGERMEVEHIVKCLDELGSNMAAESWLAAPTGYPVYKQVVQDTPQQHDTPTSNIKVQQKKKTSMLRSTSFFRKKKT
mmetsp:Transcript_7123/g.16190  ORF Transcript_7123/g.16190 Transcript_7123/m.16190 type:complete len:711 (+) Transcript_7123:178-2310(+)